MFPSAFLWGVDVRMRSSEFSRYQTYQCYVQVVVLGALGCLQGLKTRHSRRCLAH